MGETSFRGCATVQNECHEQLRLRLGNSENTWHILMPQDYPNQEEGTSGSSQCFPCDVYCRMLYWQLLVGYKRRESEENVNRTCAAYRWMF